MSFSTTETGWLKRADTALAGDTLTPDDEKYLRDTFLSSRDRLSTLATTVAAVGTFLLALLAVAVAVSASVSTEDTTVAEAKEAAQLIELGCEEDADPPKAECTALKLEQAKAKAERADDHRDEVQQISKSQVATGAIMLFAFLAALASQLINPVVPPEKSSNLLTEWSAVRDRYRQKRKWIELALFLDIVGVGVLLFVGLGVVG